MKVEVHIVRAFVDNGEGGNPAGVVVDGHRYSKGQKQRIARLAGLSETAFVSPSNRADFKLEFFTPDRQISHCVHATIACFSYLKQIGRIAATHSSQETIAGTRDVFIEDDTVFMEQRAPRYVELGKETRGIDDRTVLQSLGLEDSDLMDGQRPIVVNTGNSILIVALKDESTLRKIKPDVAMIGAIGEKLGLVGHYPFTLDTRIPGRHAGARLFAPHFDIPEEAATGTAAGPLACYLFDRVRVRPADDMLIEQGHLMSPTSPSIIHVRLALGGTGIEKLMAGGRATLSGTKLINL